MYKLFQQTKRHWKTTSNFPAHNIIVRVRILSMLLNLKKGFVKVHSQLGKE